MSTTLLPVGHGHAHEDERGHSHSHPVDPDSAAARVGEQVLTVGEVDAEVARLRSGPRAALLPVAESGEGRQLRRWVTQTLVVTRLLEQEAEARSLPPGPEVEDVLPDRIAAMAVGGVLASVLRSSPQARAVYADVTASAQVAAEEIEAYLARLDPGEPRSGTAQLSPTTATSTDAVARSAAARPLLQGRAREVFLDWLSARTAERVHLEVGHEHPGDPSQPDATHRH